MRNPVTATLEPTAAGVARPSAVGLGEPGGSRFAPLFSRTVELLTIATVEDELGRPLVGVFVPDRKLI